MRKDLLIKFIISETSEKESAEVLDWAEKDKKNLDYLSKLKLTYMAQMAGNMDEVDDNSLQNFKTKITTDAMLSQNKKIALYKTLFAISATAAAILLIVFLSIPSFNYKRNLTAMKIELYEQLKSENIAIALSELPKEIIQVVYTEKGAKSTIELPDGSIVQLNSDTKLIFPNKFMGTTREVFLSGEAFFNVKADTAHPMIVNTNKDIKIKVTGTEFNVKCYDNDNQVDATLFSGSIDLITANNQFKIKPNEHISVGADKKITVTPPSTSNAREAKAWTEGRIVFDETPMIEVIKILERWHGVKIIAKDPEVLQYSITADFKSESIPQIMEIIKRCTQISYTLNNNQLFLSILK